MVVQRYGSMVLAFALLAGFGVLRVQAREVANTSEAAASMQPVRRPGGFSLHPAAGFMIGYDSNAYLDLADEEQDDLYGDAMLALTARLASGRNQAILGGWYRMRRYDSLQALDNEDYRLFINATLGRRAMIGRERWTLRPHAAYGKSMDYSFEADALLSTEEDATLLRRDRPARELQIRWDIGAGLSGPLTQKLWLELAADTGRVDYEREDLFDFRCRSAAGRLSLPVTDRMRIALAGDLSEKKNSSFDRPLQREAWRLGAHYMQTEKLVWEAEIGCFDAHSTDRVIDRSGTSYRLMGHWQINQRTHLSVSGDNVSELAEDDPGNARQVDRATAVFRRQVRSHWSWDLAAGYRLEDYDRPSPPPATDLTDAREQPRGEVTGGTRPFRDPDAEGIRRRSEQVIGSLGLDYRPQATLQFRATLGGEQTWDNVIGNYRQWRAALVCRVWF